MITRGGIRPLLLKMMLVVAALLLFNPTPASASVYGCRAGWVCLYRGPSWSPGEPAYDWTKYGVHPLYNQYGRKRIFNNSTGQARAFFCVDRDMRFVGDCVMFPAGQWADVDITPYNWVWLPRPGEGFD